MVASSNIYGVSDVDAGSSPMWRDLAQVSKWRTSQIGAPAVTWRKTQGVVARWAGQHWNVNKVHSGVVFATYLVHSHPLNLNILRSKRKWQRMEQQRVEQHPNPRQFHPRWWAWCGCSGQVDDVGRRQPNSLRLRRQMRGCVSQVQVGGGAARGWSSIQIHVNFTQGGGRGVVAPAKLTMWGGVNQIHCG
ncbi:hypothetical protein GALMADRAFT_863564 [Galerina marginata CBS 339.88]|uniref:Uncharacterized protein n=1 Tax=Galerina marginata (strain CBS 339.88) TaxID=685588 RepID=A0A067TII3_GALM3|nr:hypothetical protein GALMADRAFT_863564 [Galerina marginata CBS 339.88]